MQRIIPARGSYGGAREILQDDAAAVDFSDPSYHPRIRPAPNNQQAHEGRKGLSLKYRLQ